jgi:hypothetical protein
MLLVRTTIGTEEAVAERKAMLERVPPIPNSSMPLAVRKPSRVRALLRTFKGYITRMLRALGELIEAGGPLS